MSDQRVYNFSAGPSMLPLSVLERAGAEITNYHGSGMSVMEMSHRSKVFIQIFEETQAKLRRLMKVPDDYKILFLQTGASGQFSMVPLNLIGKTGQGGLRRHRQLLQPGLQGGPEVRPDQPGRLLRGQEPHLYPQPGPAEAGPGGQLLLLLRQQHHLRHRVAAMSPRPASVPLVCDMSSDILSTPCGRVQVRHHLRRSPEEPGPRRPDRGHHPGGPGRPRAALYPR